MSGLSPQYVLQDILEQLDHVKEQVVLLAQALDGDRKQFSFALPAPSTRPSLVPQTELDSQGAMTEDVERAMPAQQFRRASLLAATQEMLPKAPTVEVRRPSLSTGDIDTSPTSPLRTELSPVGGSADLAQPMGDASLGKQASAAVETASSRALPRPLSLSVRPNNLDMADVLSPLTPVARKSGQGRFQQLLEGETGVSKSLQSLGSSDLVHDGAREARASSMLHSSTVLQTSMTALRAPTDGSRMSPLPRLPASEYAATMMMRRGRGGLGGQDAQAQAEDPTMRMFKSICLDKCPLFHGWTHDCRTRLYDVLHRVARAAGEIILREGEASRDMYFVYKGRVRLFARMH